MTNSKILSWLANNWFPVLTVVGFGLHASYTIGSIQHEFDTLKGRLVALEERSSHIPEISWRVTNAESARLEIRADIAKLSDKQDLMDGKLNRIIGVLDQKLAKTIIQ